LHGKEDSVVPVSMNDEFYEKCVAPKKRVLVEGADHANSAMTDFDAYEKAVMNFLNEHLLS
ncbi:MAG: alpha/beta hydrolase, partial [Eubacterium sp.]|nr:alpha/beta hydrolase [Eubacterium sp.]